MDRQYQVTSTQHETRKTSSSLRVLPPRDSSTPTPLTLGEAKVVRAPFDEPCPARPSRGPIRGCKYVTALLVIGVSLLGWVGSLGIDLGSSGRQEEVMIRAAILVISHQ